MENRLTIANVKVKSYVDEECKVIGYTEGHGKFENLLGALLCNLKSDKIIKIGSGLLMKSEYIHLKLVL